MVRIRIDRDPIARMIGLNMDEYRVQLSKSEKLILEQARQICEHAGTLQTKALEREGDEDDGRDNDFAWAAIYLRDALGSD